MWMQRNEKEHRDTKKHRVIVCQTLCFFINFSRRLTLLLCKHLIELFSRNVLMLQFHLRLQCCSQFRFNHTINQAFYALFLLKHFLWRILSPEYCCISKSERDCIIEAKRIIDSELAFAPSCEGLARQVQISVSKLSRGFSMMYGISVHAYVIEQRLERAAGLLLESNMNIGQIAVLVGYTKPSNFSAAFKKKYGVMPKDYREASRIK